MKLLVGLMLILIAQSAYSWDLSDLFKPNKTQKTTRHLPTKKKRAKEKPEPAPTPTPTPSPSRQNYHKVDIEWMAKYRALEAVWAYQIPEDDLIQFEGGSYYVPPVVYRHFDDMASTPKRNGSRTQNQQQRGDF